MGATKTEHFTDKQNQIATVNRQQKVDTI